MTSLTSLICLLLLFAALYSITLSDGVIHDTLIPLIPREFMIISLFQVLNRHVFSMIFGRKDYLGNKYVPIGALKQTSGSQATSERDYLLIRKIYAGIGETSILIDTYIHYYYCMILTLLFSTRYYILKTAAMSRN